MANTMVAFGMPGHVELLIILAVAVLIFGRSLPKTIGRMGTAIREFRLGLKGEDRDHEEAEQT